MYRIMKRSRYGAKERSTQEVFEMLFIFTMQKECRKMENSP